MWNNIKKKLNQKTTIIAIGYLIAAGVMLVDGNIDFNTTADQICGVINLIITAFGISEKAEGGIV